MEIGSLSQAPYGWHASPSPRGGGAAAAEDRVLTTAEARRIQQLLGEQLETVQRALEFNKQIAQQLALTRPLAQVGATEAAAAEQISVVTTERNTVVLEVQQLGYKNGFLTPRAVGQPSLTMPLLDRDTQPARTNSKLTTGRTPIFLDVDAIKQYLRNTLDKDKYNVENLYSAKGWAQAIATNAAFKNTTLMVIFLNTLWIAYDTDNNDADTLLQADLCFQIAENLFCAFFSFEILCRFFAFSRKVNAFKDGWFVFDSFLVSLMVWETWVVSFLCLIMGSMNGNPLQNSSILRALRLFRLLRASRVLRLVRSFPELMILVQAMIAAMRSVCGTMGMLLIIVYVFAILMTQLLHEAEGPHGDFATVPRSMHTLMKYAVFPDQGSFLDDMLNVHFVYYLAALLYLGLGTLTVMNLLIGVLCEVVGDVAQAERDTLLVNDIKSKLCELCPLLDGDGDKMVSAAEFQMVLKNPPACRILDEVGVDVYALLDHADFIFPEEQRVEFDKFIDIVLQFRGSNTATVKDIVHVRKCLTKEIELMEERLTKAKKS